MTAAGWTRCDTQNVKRKRIPVAHRIRWPMLTSKQEISVAGGVSSQAARPARARVLSDIGIRNFGCNQLRTGVTSYPLVGGVFHERRLMRHVACC